ncbi:MAG: peptidoglycan DD-metalloendopeptidase family protein [Gammaproteobacteria bacterium]|nr:peptidoglycan DD-metalloendopeptidase family protein [Gammaproteobacteria bacterium]
MQAFPRSLLASLCALCVIFSGMLCPTPARAEQADSKQALSKVRERIEALRKDIEKTQTLHDSVRTELRDIERQISKLLGALKTLNRKLANEQRKLNTLHQERDTLKANLATQHHLLARQVEAAFMIGRQEYLKLLLNQEDPAAVGRTMTYYDYFNRARAQRIAGIKVDLQKLQSVEQEIVAQTQALNAVKQQQLEKKAELQKNSRERTVVVAKLGKELQSKAQELKRLVEDEHRLQDLVNRLDQAMPDILTAPGTHKPFGRLRGQLIWPTRGKLLVSFGTRREGGRLKWNGVLIRAHEGQEVHAISHGRVAYADWLRGYGLLLIIDHGNGYMSLYGHNQAIYKETGEWVEAGEVIASVGKSGGQNQAGLYFEIRHNGKPTDPAHWCRGRPALARN